MLLGSICVTVECIFISIMQACVSCNRFGTGCQTIAPSGPGVTADFILYVAASGQEPCAQSTVGSQTIAFASHCQQEATLDRLGLCSGGCFNVTGKVTCTGVSIALC